MAVAEYNKLIKCRRCKSDFEPIYRNGIIISRLCLSCVSEKAKHKVKRDKNRERKEAKEKLKTHSEWLHNLQDIFNKYIRLRDIGQPCISCDKPYGTFTKSAGHYFSVGAYPNLRFNEDNVHLQCWYNCNKNKHGNTTEYLPNLIKKIGRERYERLLADRKESLSLTISDIKNLMQIYKEKIKLLEEENRINRNKP